MGINRFLQMNEQKHPNLSVHFMLSAGLLIILLKVTSDTIICNIYCRHGGNEFLSHVLLFPRTSYNNKNT